MKITNRNSTSVRRPWIQPNRKPLCDSYLKGISKSWDADTWEAYLTWYQTSRKEALIHTWAYDLICERRSESIYREFGYEVDEALQQYCELLLSTLPKIEEQILRLYFLEGKTELQIALKLRISKSGVHVAKKRGLFRLVAPEAKEKVGAIRTMRGISSQSENERPSIWDSSEGALCERRSYDPADWKSELQAIKNVNVRKAVAVLPQTQQQIIYLRFWCCLSTSITARLLGIGQNAVHEICDTAVFRIKSRVVELTQEKKEVASCI